MPPDPHLETAPGDGAPGMSSGGPSGTARFIALANPLAIFRGSLLVNAVVLLGIGAVLFGLTDVAREWRAPLRPSVDIQLGLWRLPQYTLFSLARGLAAYFFSLLFTVGYAYWAAYDRRAERILIPALDILQSIPVLGFLPGLVLALVGIFPHSNLGLELACVLMIFTGQVWNMTFSLYYSLKSVPDDYRFVGRLTGLSRFQFLKGVELPLAANGLVFNSMMSMAGGWFFLTITEAFTLGDRDFRLPGLGSYMSVAQERGDGWSQACAVVAMVVMIVVLDQLLWRPLVVWTQRFKLEDIQTGPVERSWFLDLILRATVIQRVVALIHRPRVLRRVQAAVFPTITVSEDGPAAKGLYALVVGLLGAGALYGAWRVLLLLAAVPLGEWLRIVGCTGLTFLRVFGALALGTLWTVPVGIAIGRSARMQRLLQPVIQIAASFPAPMLFANVLALIFLLHGSLEWGSVVLMLLGTQWYILFNVISGAAAIPADLHACAAILHLSRLERWRKFYLPAIFPALVVGWITAAGGAWNASIVSEYVNSNHRQYVATGLGSLISQATEKNDMPLLTAAVLFMAVAVVGVNRLLWKPLQRFAEDRCRITN